MPGRLPVTPASATDVGTHTDQHKQQRADQHDPLDGGVIPAEDPVHDELPHARPGEDGLGEDSAGKQHAGLEADDGQDGWPGVPQGVPQEDGPARQALGAGGADVVPGQVWSIDSTYVPVQQGFMYLGGRHRPVQSLRVGLATVQHPGWRVKSNDSATERSLSRIELAGDAQGTVLSGRGYFLLQAHHWLEEVVLPITIYTPVLS